MFDTAVFDSFGISVKANVSKSGLEQPLEEECVLPSVSGVVVPGAQLGRTIGFPTANMILPDDQGLETGVYAVVFEDGLGKSHYGVANFGRRPTVEEAGALILETYLLDFAGDLYGQHCKVNFVAFVRPELKFASMSVMAERIAHDVREARIRLAMTPMPVTT